MNIENLRIQRVIVHEAPVASAVIQRVLFSDAPMALEPEGEACLCERFASALGRESHSFELGISEASDGSVFDHASRLLEADDAQFVQISKTLAQKLSSAQTSGGINAGLAVIVTASASIDGAERRLAMIVKAESDTAFRQELEGGQITLKFVNDLFLGRGQRLYKIGCFIEVSPLADSDNSVREPADFKVLVFDQQMSVDGKRPAALYFYRTFLGCQIAETARKQSKDFFEAARKSIGELGLPADERVGYLNDLTSYMRSQKPTYSISDFCDEFLKNEHAPAFKKSMKAKKIDSRSHAKDNTSIATRLKHRRLHFSSQVNIVGTSEAVKKSVKIGEVVDGWTTVTIEGVIEDA